MLSGPWTWRRFRSFMYLALAFWRRRFRRFFFGRSEDGGVRRFLDNYAGEGMVPLTAAQAGLVQAIGNCIYCGLCEAACPLPLDRWPAYSRALDQANQAALDIPAACPPGCGACAQVCPTHVPLHEIPAFVHRNPG